MISTGMGENQNVREIPTINNFSINKNQGKLKSNDRKRKQIADISSVRMFINSLIHRLIHAGNLKKCEKNQIFKFKDFFFTIAAILHFC